MMSFRIALTVFIFVTASLSGQTLVGVLPQLVAGDFPDQNVTFTTQIRLSSIGLFPSPSCPVTIRFTRGVGIDPAVTLLSNGEDLGNAPAFNVPNFGSIVVDVTTNGDAFIGAAFVETSNPSCEPALNLQGGYRIERTEAAVQTASGVPTQVVQVLVEDFQVPPGVGLGSGDCVAFTGTQGVSHGAAAVSDAPAGGLSVFAWNREGIPILNQPLAFDGGQAAFNLEDTFSFVPPSSFTGKICNAGPPDSPPVFVTTIQNTVNANDDILLTTANTIPGNVGCIPGEMNLCLDNNRFQVEALWRNSATGPSQLARVAGVVPNDQGSGLFFFQDPDNWEMLVKVLDGCQNNGHFWVFYAATTNVEFTVTVTDTLSGEQQTVDNPFGTPFEPILDTQAFATCP